MTHTHPHPLSDQIAQYGGAALLIVMIIAAVGQIALATQGLPLFLFSGIVTLLLIAPVLLLISATPAVAVSPDGITLLPRVWRSRFVAWADVAAIKDYPLLPPKEGEITRRAVTGRRRYRPAEGKMLVIPSLPAQYRFTGLFAGEGFTGVVALTNRTHTDYEALIRQVMQYAGDTNIQP